MLAPSPQSRVNSMEHIPSHYWMLFLVPILAFVPIWLLVRHLGAKTQVTDYDRRAHQREPLNCPRCQQAMTPGLAMLGRGLIWRKPETSGAGTFSMITQALPNTISMNIRPAYNRAWRCEACSTAVIDYEHMVRVK